MTRHLLDGTLSEVAFDNGVELLIGDALVRLEGPCAFTVTDRAILEFEPERAARVAAQLVSLLGVETVVSLVDGDRLAIEGAQEEFRLVTLDGGGLESWSIVRMDDGWRLVDNGSGEVAEWSPKS